MMQLTTAQRELLAILKPERYGPRRPQRQHHHHTRQPGLSWAERDRDAAARNGWSSRRHFPCPFTRHEHDNRNPAAVLLAGDNQRLRVYCHKCGASASATDAAEGVKP